ncbi:MAG: nucleoside-diphosphate kinase [Sarcina sp.]
MEKTLVLIKPDAVERNLIGAITKIYEDNGLKVINMKLEKITEELAKEHYKEHEGKSFYENLIKYITRSPLVAMVLTGENAIEKVRELNGKTNPENAAEGTIRKLYAINGSENSVHASDSLESANREIKLWFK